MDTMERFEKAIIELYGKEIEAAVEFCTDQAVDIFGESPSLDELFVVWGSICKDALARASEWAELQKCVNDSLKGEK